MSLPYYKRFPRDFLEGTIGLSFEAKGAYAIVLDLIYMREGRLPDDARYIAGQLGCSVRKWRALLAELIDAGKLVCERGMISNFRADYLLEETRKYREQQAENGSKPRNNNTLPEPPPNHTKIQNQNQKATADDSASARFSDLDGEELGRLEATLREAAGASVNAASPMLRVISPILALLRPGDGPACDLQLDVLPAIRAAAERVRSPKDRWDYFAPMIREARDRRLQGAPAVGDVQPLRATGPPNGGFMAQLEADRAEARRRVLNG